jgi:CBS domain-containing protein
VLKIADQGHQHMFPVLGPDHKLVGVLSADVVREVMTENPSPGLVIAQDLLSPQFPELRIADSLQRALELLATQEVVELPVTDANHTYIGMLDRRAIIRAYRRRITELASQTR